MQSKTLILQNNSNRFGNRIKEILNVFFVCKKYHFTFSFDKFDIFNINLKKSELYKDITSVKDSEKITDSDSFFSLKDLCHYCRLNRNMNTYVDSIDYEDHFCNRLSINEYIRLSNLYLKNLWTPPLPKINIPKTTCVIHIRSGDIFDKNNFDRSIHCGYTQPPLSFYKKIISENKFKEYLILTEPDRSNPCIQELSHISNVRIQSRSFQEDLSTMLSADNIVFSNSTLCFAVMCLSDSLKNIFVCDNLDWFNIKTQTIKNIKIHTYNIQNYTNIKKWYCSNRQIKLMIDHDVDMIDSKIF